MSFLIPGPKICQVAAGMMITSASRNASIGFAREVADEAVFMDDGVVVEHGVPEQVLSNPQHERTQAFLSKVL